MSRLLLTIGDCFEIQLPNGKKAYAQYISADSRRPGGMGALIRVFDLVADEDAELDELKTAGELFPPVYVGLMSPVRRGRWRKIGWLPVPSISLPMFRKSFGTKPGVYHDWQIGNGEHWKYIGDLPPKYRALERWIIWGDELLEARIAFGQNRGDVIL